MRAKCSLPASHIYACVLSSMPVFLVNSTCAWVLLRYVWVWRHYASLVGSDKKYLRSVETNFAKTAKFLFGMKRTSQTATKSTQREKAQNISLLHKDHIVCTTARELPQHLRLFVFPKLSSKAAWNSRSHQLDLATTKNNCCTCSFLRFFFLFLPLCDVLFPIPSFPAALRSRLCPIFPEYQRSCQWTLPENSGNIKRKFNLCMQPSKSYLHQNVALQYYNSAKTYFCAAVTYCGYTERTTSD